MKFHGLFINLFMDQLCLWKFFKRMQISRTYLNPLNPEDQGLKKNSLDIADADGSQFRKNKFILSSLQIRRLKQANGDKVTIPNNVAELRQDSNILNSHLRLISVKKKIKNFLFKELWELFRRAENVL